MIQIPIMLPVVKLSPGIENHLEKMKPLTPMVGTGFALAFLKRFWTSRLSLKS